MHSGELELPKLTWCEEIRHRGDRPRLYLPSKDYRIIGCRLSDRFYDALMSGAMCMLCVVFTSKRYFYFFLSSGGWGKIKLKLTTLSRIFVRVVCRFISVAFAAQLPNGLGTHLVTVLIIFTNVYYKKKKKCTRTAVRSKISEKLIFASSVRSSDRALLVRCPQ